MSDHSQLTVTQMLFIINAVVLYFELEVVIVIGINRPEHPNM